MKNEIKVPAHERIKTGVSKAVDLASKDPKGVLSRVLKHYAEPEVERRTELAIKALAEIDKAQKEVKQLKADIHEFAADEKGEPTGSSRPPAYSKAQYEKRGKALERLNKVTSALDAAFPEKEKGEPSFDLLYKLFPSKKEGKE